MTLADMNVFSGTIQYIFLVKMKKIQGQVPGVVAYLVKIEYE